MLIKSDVMARVKDGTHAIPLLGWRFLALGRRDRSKRRGIRSLAVVTSVVAGLTFSLVGVQSASAFAPAGNLSPKAVGVGSVSSGQRVVRTSGHDLVSIGDSFTAAYGVGTDVGGPAAVCGQSDSSVGRLVGRAAGYSVTDVTCTGATARGMVNGQDRTDSAGKTIHIPPQINALNSSTDMVLVSAGGTDLGFSRVIISCLAESGKGPVAETGSKTCRQDYVKNGHDELDRRITDVVGPALDALYGQISARAPHARKFAYDYPDLFPDRANTPAAGCYAFTTTGTGDSQETDMPFTDEDVVYLHQVQEKLNALIKREAEKYGFTLLPASSRSQARTACSAAPHWVNGLNALGAPDRNGEAFHPTRVGIAHYVDVFKYATKKN